MFLTLYKSALRPIEIKALLKLKIKGNSYAPPQEHLELLATKLNDRDFCYAALGKVSRSFSAVIQQLPEELKDAVCIFYLVLRALDTIEDDMTLSNEKKEPLLIDFHNHAQDETFAISGIGDNEDYRVLLENYPKVSRTFGQLNLASKKTIIDITKRMGQGMAEFMKNDVKTIADFDLYCHYVAGLVGIGLTKLFYAFKPSSVTIADNDEVSNSMGLFLQKTNITRDFHEDLFSERSFWPEEIWSTHVKSLKYLAVNPKNTESIETLNHMVADALRHIPDCIDYLNNVKDKKIFNFTAVPQIMAVATLAKLYNNPKVLTGVVKVRKGLAARLLIYNVTLHDVYKYFRKNIKIIEKKNQPGTPYYYEMAKVLKSVKSSLNNHFV